MSATPGIVALLDDATTPDGGWLVLSPAVGIVRGLPRPGRTIAGGETFARLTIVGRTHALLLPEEIGGVVTGLAVEGFGADAIAVEHGQPILTLAAIASATDARSKARAAAPGSKRAAASEIPAGCHAVLSPADGVFYRRPRPSDPAYVEAGARIHPGQTLALIEAMKCFSAIVYGGAGLPEEAELVEIRAEDAAEVKHGQVLFVVR
jgi:acetyl-CoA carboxylase biotin carboxyl carrier protein